MVKKLIEIAQKEIGYLEKKSARDLDDKTKNAGSGNFTKYARDLDGIPGFYNTPKQGFAWCDVFVDWCFVQAFGTQKAMELLCQPGKSLGAGCGFSARYYQEKGQFYTQPQPGDQIFFVDSIGEIYHTGIVCEADSRWVNTVEGNTSDSAGGGSGVWQKTYSLTDSRIYGYGRPAYETSSPPTQTPKTEQGDFSLPLFVMRNGSQGPQARALQQLLQANGFSCGVWGDDGNFGPATQEAVTGYQKKHKLQVDGMAGPETWGRLLGING